MAHSRCLGSLGHRRRVLQFLLRREVLPEEGDAECSVSTFKCALQTVHVVHVGSHNLGPKLLELPRLVGVDVASERAGNKRTFRISRYGSDEPASLSAGGAKHLLELWRQAQR